MPFGMLAMGIFWIGVITLRLNGLVIGVNVDMIKQLKMLKSRLAKGEITIDEYEKLIEKLRNK